MPRAAVRRSRKNYRAFHGRRVRYKIIRHFHVPETLTVLGECIAIEYECDKYNGGGDGTLAVYRHEFERPALVCMDEKAKKQLYIMGNSVKVTTAGIEG